MDLTPQRISEGTVAFMFETSRALTLTDWAMNRSGNKHEHERMLFQLALNIANNLNIYDDSKNVGSATSAIH